MCLWRDRRFELSFILQKAMSHVKGKWRKWFRHQYTAPSKVCWTADQYHSDNKPLAPKSHPGRQSSFPIKGSRHLFVLTSYTANPHEHKQRKKSGALPQTNRLDQHSYISELRALLKDFFLMQPRMKLSMQNTSQKFANLLMTAQ